MLTIVRKTGLSNRVLTSICDEARDIVSEPSRCDTMGKMTKIIFSVAA